MLRDSKDPDHLKKTKRDDCWSKIPQELKLPIPEMKKKLDLLTGSNQGERSREKKSIFTDSGADKVYGSEWFDFISNNNDTGNTQEGGIHNAQSQHSVQTESTPSIKTEYTSISSNQAATSNQQSETTQVQDQVVQQPPQSPIEPSPSPQQPPCKKKHTLITDANGNDSIDSVLKETFEIREKASSSTNDSCIAFVNHIAQELRKYDPHTLSCVKNAISNIIHEADMGKYQMYRPRYNTQQYQQLPGCSAGSTSTLPPSPASCENLQATP